MKQEHLSAYGVQTEGQKEYIHIRTFGFRLNVGCIFSVVENSILSELLLLFFSPAIAFHCFKILVDRTC